MKDSFLVRPATAGGWDHIAAALGRLFVRLSLLDAPHFVIVQVSAEHYVQVMIRPGRYVWAESVGDVFLEVELDDEQRRILGELGWNDPAVDDRAEGNYWRQWQHPFDALAIATVLIMTCVDVFDAGPWSNVAVEVGEALADRVP